MSRDATLIEQVQAAAAAVGRSVDVARDPEDVRGRWRRAPVVFVGVESAARTVSQGLPARRGVHVVGREAAEVVRWSVPLEASVLVLPESVGLVSAIIGDQGVGGRDEAAVVRVVGGSGGVGVSTVAAGVAQCAARAGARVALVDLDAGGGGLDLLLGAEGEAGWRWRDLAAATGHVGDLTGRLPRAAGIDVVSHGRPGTEPVVVPAEAERAVVASLRRSHDLVVLDAAAGSSAAGDLWSSGITWVVVAADLRGIVAARRRALDRGWVDAEVVVRRGPARRVPAGEVAEAVGLSLAGVVPDDRRLPAAAEQGEPPARLRRRPFSRACAALAGRLGAVSSVAAATPAGPGRLA